MNKKIFYLSLFILTLSLAILGTNNYSKPESGNVTISRIRDVHPKTNSWFSSAYVFPSSPMYSYPASYRITKDGLALGIPQPVSNEKLVAAPFIEWCTINFNHQVTATQVVDYGDWNVVVEVSDSQGKWQLNLTQGSPIIQITGPTADFTVSCPDSVSRDHQAGKIFSRGDKYLLTQSDSLGHYSLSVMPDDSEATLALFSQTPSAEFWDTQASWKKNSVTKKIDTEYTWGASGPAILTTIWPHQLSSLNGQYDILGSYHTVIGELKLIQTNSLKTALSIPNLPFDFARVTNQENLDQLKAQIIQDAQIYLADKNIPAGDYFRGTWLGALTTLTQLANLYEIKEVSTQLNAMLQSEVLKIPDSFHYDEKLHMLVANTPEFGNEKGNDHHFHYGYYIRAASVAVSRNSAISTQLSPMITEMIADIATTDRNSTRYPYLRSLSIYEGHSWADGVANFADGNNQESTSEALNAWYAVSLWGQTTSNQAAMDLGEWLFAQELSGTKAYWFGVNNPFPSDYKRTMASLVWGGKREFATWFSPQPLAVYGIQWLPLTPASSYLKELALPVHIQAAEQLDPKFMSQEWVDLHLAVKSFIDPEKVAPVITSIQTTAGLKLKSLLLQTVYSNLE